MVALVLGAVNDLTTREARETVFDARKEDREWVAAAERNRESLGSLNMITNLSKRWFTSASTRLESGEKSQIANVRLTSWLRFVGSVLRIAAIGYGVWLVIGQELTPRGCDCRGSSGPYSVRADSQSNAQEA